MTIRQLTTENERLREELATRDDTLRRLVETTGKALARTMQGVLHLRSIELPQEDTRDDAVPRTPA
jgi:hypothetical protein